MKVANYGFDWDWSACGVPLSMSREEAHFWFLVITTLPQLVSAAKTTDPANATPAAVAASLKTRAFDGVVEADDIRKALALDERRLSTVIVRPLLALGGVEAVLDHSKKTVGALLVGLLDHATYLDEKSRGILRERCKGALDPSKWPKDYYAHGPVEYYLAARAGGFEKELLDLVESWSDDQFSGDEWHDHYQRPQRIVFGLGDPALVEQHWRRLKLKFRTYDHVVAWLAHTEANALDAVRDSILANKNREESEKLIAALARVHAPEAAPIMLELKRSSKAPKAAGEWLDANVEHAIPGLLATAAGRGALAELAVEWLRGRKRAGDEAAIAKAVAAAPADVGAKVRTLVLEHEEKTYPVLDEAPAWFAEDAAPAPAGDTRPAGLELGPAERLWASWDGHVPVAMPSARKPFDPGAAAGRLALAEPIDRLRVWDWAPCGLDVSMSPEEGHYWLVAMTQAEGRTDRAPALLATRLKSHAGGAPTLEQTKALVKSGASYLREPAALALVAMHGPEGALGLVLDDTVMSSFGQPYEYFSFLDGVQEHVIPRLSMKEVKATRTALRDKITAARWNATDEYQMPHPAFYLGAFLGLHEPLRAVVASWPDDLFAKQGACTYRMPQYLVLGLGDKALVLSEMKRLGLKLRRPAQARAWLALTGTTDLGFVRESIADLMDWEDDGGIAGALGLARVPETIPIMKSFKKGAAKKVAAKWLEANAHLVAASAKPAKPAKPAKAPAPPAWVPISELPPVVVGGKRFSDELVADVIGALRASPLETPSSKLKALRERGDRASLDAFAWRLFELWLGEGAPAKDKWALHAVGLLGNDAGALRLAPLVRNWPGESQHQRAVTGLECLRAIGSDVALMQLNGIAQKLKFKGLKARAQELMELIAKDRGMTRPELEDRIVPDCDLDEKGTRVFDFGPRQFSFVLGPDMKPLVRDAAGKIADLPKPGAKDDAEKANAATEEWKLMKKQIKEVAKIQAERLEQAMVTGRRWKKADFELLVVKHPLLTHLVRLLVLGGHDAKGELVATFRVTEDGTYADSKDEATKLTGVETCSIVHPLDLDEATKGRWGQVFADYQLMPPFLQLGRPIFTLEKKEEKATALQRLAAKKVAAITLSGTLDKLGWERGVPQDGGCYFAHSKPFHGANVTAVVEYDGIPVGMAVDWDDQEVKKAWFIEGIHGPQGYPEDKGAIALAKVDPIAISEVLKDLAAIAEKAKN